MASTLAAKSATLSAGEWLDRYELVYPIARGGMAQVWLAKLHSAHGFEKLVALKTILPEFADDPRFRRMFVREARLAAGIDHPNVARVLDLGEDQGRLYLVMEWVNGDSINELDRAAWNSSSSLPISVLVRIMVDLCAGLHAAHGLTDARGEPLNLVHRDVSPQNVMVTVDGVVKLIDFGVAKARFGAHDASTHDIKGKLQYMAPEQELGRRVDRRSDIWAVGATLYRLLTGRAPFVRVPAWLAVRGPTPCALPAPLPPHVPAALARVVLKALELEPTHRYATAAQLGAALESSLDTAARATTGQVAACVARHLGKASEARWRLIAEALAGPNGEPTTLLGVGGWSNLAELSLRNALGSSSSLSLSGAKVQHLRLVNAKAMTEREPWLAQSGEPECEGRAPSERPRRQWRARAWAIAGVLALAGVATGVCAPPHGAERVHAAAPRRPTASLPTQPAPAPVESLANAARIPTVKLQSLPLLNEPHISPPKPAFAVARGSAATPAKARKGASRRSLQVMSSPENSIRLESGRVPTRSVIDDGF